MAGYADSVAGAAQSAATGQPTLQRLVGGWNSGVESMEVLARIPSLRELLDGSSSDTSEAPDLSPQFSSQLQPLLPHLHTFDVPFIETSRVSEQAVAVLVDSSAAFLTAYSAQLQVLKLLIYSTISTGRLLESVLQCARLRSFIVGCNDHRVTADIPEHHVDAQHLDEAVAELPPLQQLTELRVAQLYFSVRAMTQFLTQCPAVDLLKLRGVRMHLPYVLQLSGDRTVEVDHR